ncbi:MAG: hypothetical protein IPN34_27605 [Planctomycetes bacterium]|nr:hypothetical protein [Planctomycetota bacterium]
MDGTKLAVSEDEREFADQLYTKHKRTFDALFEVLLSTLLSDNPPLKAIVEQARDTAKGPLAVRANGVSIAGATGSEFLAAVVRFLDEKGALDLHVPFSTGTKRFWSR